MRATLPGPGTFYVYARFYCREGTRLWAAPGETTYELSIKALSGTPLSAPFVAPPVISLPLPPPPPPITARVTHDSGLAVGKAKRVSGCKRRFSISAVAAAVGQRVVVATLRNRGHGLRRISTRPVTLLPAGTRARRSIDVAAPRNTRAIRVRVFIETFQFGGQRYASGTARRTAAI